MLFIFRVVLRQKHFVKWRKIRFPETSFGVPKAIEENNNTIYDINEINFKMNGTPACSGNVLGRACVIKSLEEIYKLQTG